MTLRALLICLALCMLLPFTGCGGGSVEVGADICADEASEITVSYPPATLPASASKIGDINAINTPEGFSLAKYPAGDIPRIYIETVSETGENASPSHSHAAGITAEYSQCLLVVVDKKGGGHTAVADGTGMVRVRGNSTAGAPKKPYNIRFTDKVPLLGMTRGRKWCLLANMYDKSLMRNKISYDFTATAGCSCPMQTRFVDVYVNGRLQGNYTLTTPASDGYIGLDIGNGDYLIERHGDRWDYGSTSRRVSPVYGIPFSYDNPDESLLTDEQRMEIKSLLTAVDEALEAQDEAAIRKVMDINSFVAMYVTEELFKDCDICHGSTYHYIKDGRIYAGPIWDMDLSMGNVSHWYDQEKYRIYNNMSDYRGRSLGLGNDDSATGLWAQLDWYRPLMQCSFFRVLVHEKYVSLLDDIENIYREGGLIDQYLREFGASFKRNYAECGWSLTTTYCPYELERPFPTFGENVEYLRDWLRRRDTWLRGYFGISGSLPEDSPEYAVPETRASW